MTDFTTDPTGASPDRTLTVVRFPGETPEAAMARKAYDPLCRAVVMARDVSPLVGKRDLNESQKALEKQVQLIHRGDLSEIEVTLAVHANTLDLVFNDMLRRAAANAGKYLEATETYMRMALKAQSQCRATLETLAAIKNPPVVIAKQANISAGPQQVNNGVPGPVGPKALAATSEPAPAASLLAHEQGLSLTPCGVSGELEQAPAQKRESRRPRRASQ